MGLQRMCRAVKAPFLPQSPNFEAYESKVAAIVLDATDLLVCFIQCLTGRNWGETVLWVGQWWLRMFS